MAIGAYVGESKILDGQSYRTTDGFADAEYSFKGSNDRSIFFDGQLFTVVINGVIYTDCLLQLYESGSNFAYISIPNEPTWSIIVRPPSYNLYVPYDALADVFELSMQIYMDSGVARKITGGYISAYGLIEATNLAVDGSFENVSNNWICWLAEPTDTSQAKDGSRSLKLGGDALASSMAAVSLVAGHKYYGREYLKTAGELTAADCRFELVGAVDGVEKAFVFGWNRGNYPDWTAISGIITSDGAYSFGLRTFTVAGSCDAWVDSIVVLDLTATYGVGNEPTKEWCDANIQYFEGTAMISNPSKPNIARKLKKVYIGDENGVARLCWSAREKIVGTLTLRPSADISVGHTMVPASSTLAYLLINEEESDYVSTYIHAGALTTSVGIVEVESKFALTNVSQLEVSKYAISSVNIYADSALYESSSTESYNEFVLEINGVETSAYRATHMKDGINISAPDAIPLINEAIAVTGILPSINIIIKSRSGIKDGSKDTPDNPDITQVFVTLGYEGY